MMTISEDLLTLWTMKAEQIIARGCSKIEAAALLVEIDRNWRNGFMWGGGCVRNAVLNLAVNGAADLERARADLADTWRNAQIAIGG